MKEKDTKKFYGKLTHRGCLKSLKIVLILAFFMILPFLITPFRAPIGHKSNWEKECSITTIRPFKNYTEKNKSPISNNAIDPFINITEPISLNTNNSLPLSIDNDKALQSFNFSINQINRTKNFINNSEMNDISGAYSESEKKTLGSQAPPWALNNSRTKSEGISLSYLSESSQNNVLNFSINGTEGKEPFYLFNKNNYTENFYSLGGWGRKFLNDTVSRGKYNITLGSDLLLPSSESGSVSSIANIEDQFVDGRHYVGELNHSFHYNGTDTLKDALFQFDYKLSTAAENNSVNLSVYISNPQNEFSYIDSFYENSSESQSHATYNVSDLDTIIQERGDYHIIFHFKHFFHNKTNLGGWQNQISIDNVGFFLNYTARNVISNETFEINQELYNNNTILNQGRLTLEFNPGIFPDFFHVENWTFFCLINEYECFKKPIGDLNQNSWHSISSNVPEEYLSGLNFSLSFFLKYNGSSLLRFNDTHSWGLSLDNVSLICNQVQKWNSLSDHFFLLSPEKYLSPAMTDVQSIIIENDKSYPSILYEKSAGFWTSDYYPSLNITVDESYYEDNHLNDPSFREIQISGQIVFHYYTWREFLYEEFTDLISDVFSYYDSVQSDLIHGIREWDNILRFNKSLYAGFDGDFLKMQMDLYEKSGSFSRLFSSFLFFLSETEPQALNLTSEVYRSLVKNTTNSILPRKTKLIRNILNTTMNQSISSKNTAIEDLRNSLNDMTLDQKPESLNLSSFYYDLLQLKSKFSDINSGMGGTLILKNASISYPSITFWKSMINNLESNLDADIESGMSIPLQWVDIPKIFNNNTSLTAGFPANVYSLYSSLYNSEKNLDLLSSGGESLLKNLNIQTRHSSLQDYHFLCLFNAIHEVFRSVNETEYLLAEISSLRILGEIRDDPINFSIVNKENVQKNELRAHSDSKISTHTFNPLTLESIRTQPEIKPPIYTDSILTHSITSEVQNNMGNFLEDLLSSENSEPTSCKRYGDHFYLEYQLFYPRRNDFGKLETVPGPSGTIDLNKGFEASTYKNDGRPISSQDLILPDTFFSLLLMQGNLTLGKDYPSPILRTTYYKGNFPLYSNLTNIHIFNISSFNSDKEISENNNETLSIENLHNLGINPPFSQTENMKITSFTITHPILIPKEISMTLDWLQKIPNSVSQFSVFEVSGTNSLRLNSLEFVEPSELFQDILKRTVFLDDGFVTGDIIGIKLEFESLNLVLRGLNSLQLNEKCILNYTLREDTGDGPIKTNYTREISISIVIYPPLSYDDPLVGKGALISLSIIIAFFAIIMILRIRKRHWNTPLMDVIKRMKRKRNFLKD